MTVVACIMHGRMTKAIDNIARDMIDKSPQAVMVAKDSGKMDGHAAELVPKMRKAKRKIATREKEREREERREREEKRKGEKGSKFL